jgi:enoyl-CoA hydratase/carnithine racemase
MPRYESPYDPSKSPKNFEHVIYEKKGHVGHVTINRPEVKNALHSFAYAELRACWRDIGLDPDICCGIVTGTGSAFSAGRDVPDAQQAGAARRLMVDLSTIRPLR